MNKLIPILFFIFFSGCHYLHVTNAGDADLSNELYYALKADQEYRNLMNRQKDQISREQTVYFYVILGKSIEAEIGREWPDGKPGFRDTRLTDDEINRIGEIIYKIVQPRHPIGVLRFTIMQENKSRIIYKRKLGP